MIDIERTYREMNPVKRFFMKPNLVPRFGRIIMAMLLMLVVLSTYLSTQPGGTEMMLNTIQSILDRVLIVI
ncbi:hypothetical protein pEaSNUABM37_00184 [Erwinia phage pEa_SNUABM_37]|nr:hypothetical protein pEaSNUABM37_00184 [Erwinia phage pEa_SNUABM_37]QXO10654.1 hypothetical protein pEaSNUABM48_00184 [Erwinia phage pEa_SNUABM_48]